MITQLPQIVVKRLVPCDCEGWASFAFRGYGGEPTPQLHPLKYQQSWLEGIRGGIAPPEVMDSLARVAAVAQDNNVSLEDYVCSRDGCRGKNGKQPLDHRGTPH